MLPTEYKNRLIKAYEETPAGRLPDAPVFALQGLSESDADLLKDAFNIRTIRDLAELKFARWAEELVEYQSSGGRSLEDFHDKLIKKYEKKTATQVLKAPISALRGVSENDAELIKQAFNVKTVKAFANLKYIKWAREMCSHAERELVAHEPEQVSGIMKSKFSYLLGIFIIVVILAGLFLMPESVNESTGEPGKDSVETLSPSKEPLSDTTPEIEQTEGSAAEKVPPERVTEENTGTEKKSTDYTVKEGDTLSEIAFETLGSHLESKKIYEANKDKIQNPDRIFTGQVLEIPR